MQAQSAGTASHNGPQSPFEDVKMGGPEDTWWDANEQRMQEQEKQRAAQLQHTRAWAEAQVVLSSGALIMDASKDILLSAAAHRALGRGCVDHNVWTKQSCGPCLGSLADCRWLRHSHAFAEAYMKVPGPGKRMHAQCPL